MNTAHMRREGASPISDDGGAAPASVEDVTALLEERGLTVILQQFVAECAQQQPLDIVEFMRDWALARRPLGNGHLSAAGVPSSAGASTTPLRRNSIASLHPANLSRTSSQASFIVGTRTPTSVRSVTPSKAPTGRSVCILAAAKSNKEQLVSVLFDAATLGGGVKLTQAATEYVDALHSRIMADGASDKDLNFITLPADTSSGNVVSFIETHQPGFSNDMITVAAHCDVALIVASIAHAPPDLRLKRQGELYNRAILAHSLGIKRLVLVVTEARGAQSETLSAFEDDLRKMTTSCGFEEMRVKICHLPATAEDIVGAVTSLTHAPSVKYSPQVAKVFRVNGIVLNGTGIAPGDMLKAYSHGHLSCRVETIVGRQRSAWPETADMDSSGGQCEKLLLHQTGSLTVSVATNVTECRVAVAGPFMVHSRGRILFIGSITEIVDPPTTTTSPSANHGD